MVARPLYAGILACLSLCAQALAGQTVRGTVMDSTTGLPVRGAFVELLDTAWARRAGALADSTGSFRLAPPVGGSYLLRAEAIGYADGRVLTLTVGPGEQPVLALRLSPNPVPLAELKVPAMALCNLRSDSSSGLLAVWAEARKALSVTDWSARQSGLVMVIRTEQQGEFADWHLSAQSRIDTVSGRPPYVTLSVDSLFRAGLVQPKGSSHTFYGPGPEYILSDRFLESHCFAVRQRGRRIGLSFRPAATRPRGDIRGTLWLDRETSMLSALDFAYVGLTDVANVSHGDGHIEFARTSAGFWIIRRWSIRLHLRREMWSSIKEMSGEVLDSWMKPPSVSPEGS